MLLEFITHGQYFPDPVNDINPNGSNRSLRRKKLRLQDARNSISRSLGRLVDISSPVFNPTDPVFFLGKKNLAWKVHQSGNNTDKSLLCQFNSMADQHATDGSSTSGASGESSESPVEVKIKTLDSQIYSFQVDKKMPVSAFKEKIADQIGVPVGQQRLIFRGKVLKDDHQLLEYQVENGDTLHLVARQPAQSQPSSGVNSGETTGDNNNRVLGTFNVGDQVEGVAPDLGRVIGAVLNSFGIGNQLMTNGTSGGQTSVQLNVPSSGPQGNETETLRSNAASQTQGGHQVQPGLALPNLSFNSLPQVLHIPLGGAAPIPSIHVPIPDSLNTLSEFINCMELAFSRSSGNQANSSSTGSIPTVELPSNSRGVPTPEALGIVMRHAERLLSSQAVAALSRIAGRLEQDGVSTDPIVRGQIQTESAQVGVAMQQLGALFLELGRTILTLRMGRSPDESSVNSGPAVYISPSGPNPIMVQPFPLQTSSLVGGPVSPLNPVSLGPVGIGSAPRNINIHIHAVGSRPGIPEGVQGEHASSGESGPMRALPLRNILATYASPRPTGVAVSSNPQPGIGVSMSQAPDAAALSTVIAEVNSRIRNFVDNMQGENQGPSGRLGNSTVQDSSNVSGSTHDIGNDQLKSTVAGVSGEPDAPSTQEAQSKHSKDDRNDEIEAVLGLKDGSSMSLGDGSSSYSSGEFTIKPVDVSGSNDGHDVPQDSNAGPLGLGLGGLQLKRRSRPSRSQGKSDDGGSSVTPNQNQQVRTGEQVLQSSSSRTATTHSPMQQPPFLGQMMESMPPGGLGSDGQFDAAGMMSQVLQSPALNGLLAGVSEQAGVDSPDVLRNMLQQFTQNPVIMSTVNQLAQQINPQDFGDVLSGMGGQGGGIDLSRMVQQMMPVVSRALSGVTNSPQPCNLLESEPQPESTERRLSTDGRISDQNSQADLHQVIARIEQQSSPEDIFQAILENVIQSSGDGRFRSLSDELCREDGLASEYMRMLLQDLNRRLEGDQGSEDS
ncbi:Ubiquitin-like domain [Dillenia turbinata]|uniref:Ubiquitin-like domain n=1 Tax=Dillenia turbinata TaxID=194707 RepID=A0AAN8W321_9MAGN